MTKTQNTVNKTNLFKLIDDLIIYEKEHGVVFNKDGYPIFKTSDFLNEIGDSIIPYTHRNDTTCKNKTIICFYEKDIFLYRKLSLKKLIEISNNLKNYKGFVGFDLSIFRDFLYPFQEFYILANLVISVFFVINGNKMIPNLRADQTGGTSYFNLFNEAPIVCCGTLGCSKEKKRKILNIKEIEDYCKNHPNQKIIQYGSYLYKSKNTIHFKSYGRKEKKKNG